MIMKELNLKAGTKTAGKEVVGTLTAAQVEEIAKTKITDTNTQNIESMKKMVIGTARSMGVQVTA
jgi:large subunit ribosomal protein L11